MSKDMQKVESMIEDLAAMVAQGFSDVEHRLSELIDQLDKKLSDRIDNVEQGLNDRVDVVGDDVRQIQGMLRPTIAMVDDHDVRIKQLEKRVV